MADKKQFSNTKSIVRVETGIATLISYRHYVEWDRFVTLTGAQAEWGLCYRIYVLTGSFTSVQWSGFSNFIDYVRVFCVYTLKQLSLITFWQNWRSVKFFFCIFRYFSKAKVVLYLKQVSSWCTVRMLYIFLICQKICFQTAL